MFNNVVTLTPNCSLHGQNCFFYAGPVPSACRHIQLLAVGVGVNKATSQINGVNLD